MRGTLRWRSLCGGASILNDKRGRRGGKPPLSNRCIQGRLGCRLPALFETVSFVATALSLTLPDHFPPGADVLTPALDAPSPLLPLLPASRIAPRMNRSKLLPLVVAGLFFALALYMLLTAPSDEFDDDPWGGAAGGLGGSKVSTSQQQHPCPYADILGLDENSINPHEAGGSMPPLPGMASYTGISAQPRPAATAVPTNPAATASAASAPAAASNPAATSPPAAAASVGSDAVWTTTAAPSAAAAAGASATGAAPPALATESRPIAEDERAIRSQAAANGAAASIKEELKAIADSLRFLFLDTSARCPHCPSHCLRALAHFTLFNSQLFLNSH